LPTFSWASFIQSLIRCHTKIQASHSHPKSVAHFLFGGNRSIMCSKTSHCFNVHLLLHLLSHQSTPHLSFAAVDAPVNDGTCSCSSRWGQNLTRRPADDTSREVVSGDLNCCTFRLSVADAADQPLEVQQCLTEQSCAISVESARQSLASRKGGASL